MVKQTAGRDALNDFAPKFAELNDDMLFGEVWSREDQLPLKTRSIVTITALISKGIVDSSLTYHISTARKNGVTRTEMAEIFNYPSGLLRRVAQRLGRVPYGKGGLRRGMKVLAINGSTRKDGCTYLALLETAKALEAEGIETEIVQMGSI